jgi:glycosyltransferase involved in cell wall biosynthesis
MAILSIIVPVYNVDPFLKKCIDSILSQSFTDFELIIVDDGSTDNCGAICDDYAAADSRVSVIHKVNEGVVSARKAGLAVASGKYVGYVDGDDWIDRDMYHNMIDNAIRYDCDLVMCDVEHEHHSKNPHDITGEMLETGYYTRLELEEKIFPIMLYSGIFYYFGIYPVIWNKLFRRDMLIKHQFAIDNNIKNGEDAACVYPYFLEINNMYFMKHQYLYHYRHSDVQMTATYDKNSFDRFKSLYNFFNKSNMAKSKYSGQLDYYYAYLSKMLISNELKKENKIPFLQKIKNINEIIAFAHSHEFIKNININSFSLEHKIYFKLFRKSHAFLLAMCIKTMKLFQKILKIFK